MATSIPDCIEVHRIEKWLDKHAQNISNMQVFDGNVANHVLVNEYKSGQGIMPHTDGPLFFPTISTINLGSPILLKLYKSPVSNESFNESLVKEASAASPSLEDRFVGSLLLMPRSLLILKDDLYHNYYHGIDEVVKDTIEESVLNLNSTHVELGVDLERETRISLTIRYVPKTLRVKFL